MPSEYERRQADRPATGPDIPYTETFPAEPAWFRALTVHSEAHPGRRLQCCVQLLSVHDALPSSPGSQQIKCRSQRTRRYCACHYTALRRFPFSNSFSCSDNRSTLTATSDTWLPYTSGSHKIRILPRSSEAYRNPPLSHPFGLLRSTSIHIPSQ